jgi:hypothetical protein
MYYEEPETIRRYFQTFAKQMVGTNQTIVDVTSIGQTDDKYIKRLLAKPMEDVTIIKIKNIISIKKFIT